MPSKHTLDIKIVNCGGLRDLMSEMEAAFLVDSLGLFRNRPDFKKGMPRANVNYARAYDARGFYREAFVDADILHIIGHASGTELEVGLAKRKVVSTDLARERRKAGRPLPPIVVATGCKVQGAPWQAGMREAEAKVLIATAHSPSPACLTAFDMSFYSALLARVRRGVELVDRVEASFELAMSHYEGIHAAGTPHARFSLAHL